MSAERTPVVFIHGLWLHATSWNPWLELFRDAGYEPIAPGWPGEPPTVKEAREHPDLVANMSIDDATAHFAEIIDSLDAKAVIIGHSFGGLGAGSQPGQALDGRHLRALVLRRERQTRQHALAVEQQRASLGRPLITAVLRTGQLEHIAQRVEQRNPAIKHQPPRIVPLTSTVAATSVEGSCQAYLVR